MPQISANFGPCEGQQPEVGTSSINMFFNVRIARFGLGFVFFVFFLKLKDQPLEAFCIIKALLAKQVLKHLF